MMCFAFKKAVDTFMKLLGGMGHEGTMCDMEDLRRTAIEISSSLNDDA